MNRWIIVGVIAVSVAAIGLFFTYEQSARDQQAGSDLQTIYIGDSVVRVTVVDTPEARSKGLSGRERLARGEGMLFIFPEEGIYGFWMKDMLFPIDIVWISADKKVISIDKNVSPETYPEVFEPPFPIRYVLELPAGEAEEYTVHPSSLVDL